MEIEDKKKLSRLHTTKVMPPLGLHLRGGGGQGERSANTHFNFDGLLVISSPCSEAQLHEEWEYPHYGKVDRSQVKDQSNLFG